MREPKNVVIIRSDAIGDWLVTTPVVAALKQAFPALRLTMVGGSLNWKLMREHPLVDDVIVWHEHMDVAAKTRQLATYGFDLALIYHQTLAHTLACQRAGIPVRMGDSARIPSGRYLTEHTPVINADQSRHVVEANMGVLAPMGLSTLRLPMSAGINPVARENIQARLLSQGWTPQQPLVGIHLNPGGANRSWPAERMAQTMKLIHEKHTEWFFVLTGTELACGMRDQVLRIKSDSIFDLVGQTSLSELSALSSLYSLFVGVDSGPYHLAVAHGVPTVEIAPTKAVRPIRWGPWLVPNVVLRSPIRCALYCDHQRCPVDDCLNAITPESVAQAADSLLAGGGNRTYEDSKKDWFKKSQSIVLIDSGLRTQDVERARQVLSQDPDIRVVVWPFSIKQAWRLAALARRIQADDVTTWILDDPYWLPYFKAAHLYAPLKVFVPPLLVMLPSYVHATSGAWVDWLMAENSKLGQTLR